jgi:hypothetical protein
MSPGGSRSAATVISPLAGRCAPKIRAFRSSRPEPSTPDTTATSPARTLSVIQNHRHDPAGERRGQLSNGVLFVRRLAENTFTELNGDFCNLRVKPGQRIGARLLNLVSRIFNDPARIYERMFARL